MVEVLSDIDDMIASFMNFNSAFSFYGSVEDFYNIDKTIRILKSIKKFLAGVYNDYKDAHLMEDLAMFIFRNSETIMADQIDKECRKAACFLRQCFEKRNEKI
jgi:hypothetical protein